MLNLAIELAKNLKENKHKVACVITDKRGRILSIGQNSYNKSHPTQAYYAKQCKHFEKIYLHAEIDALIKLNHRPHKIYIARVNKKGEPKLAAPCSICAMAIKEAGIKEIYHT